MAKDNTFNNLRDMIAFIEDPNLQHDFFDLHAPHIKIDWAQLPTKPLRRADAIVGALDAQREKSEQTKVEYDAVFSELRTIALANAESENWAHLQSIIESKEELLGFYRNYFGVTFMPKSANLAVFINLVSHNKIEGASKGAVKQASETWKELLARASIEIKLTQISPATSFEPGALPPEERKQYLAAFENELRERMRGHFGKDEFYVACHPIATREFTHYVVTTSPLPHSVVIINKDKNDTDTKDDDHAKTFEIIVDEFHNRIHSSKTVLIGYVPLAECFIRTVLHSRKTQTKRLNYSSSLQIFRDKGVLNKLSLPEEAIKEGAKAWIESLDIRLKDDLLPTLFRGSDQRDIYAEIENQINAERFPASEWCLVGATIKVFLPGVSTTGNQQVFQQHAAGEKTYKVKITDGSFSILGENTSFNRQHLNVLESLKDRWGIQGLDRGQKALGKKKVSVQGEMLP